MKPVRHRIPSECWSTDDDAAAQSFADWGFLLESISFAASCHIDTCTDNPFVNAFPGDHYRLLAGLITKLDRSSGPLTLIDIGTHLGTSARMMLDYSSPKDRVFTFDIASWETNQGTVLTQEDFDTRLTQYVEDLQELPVWEKHKELIRNADFIMCDGPKDGKFEQKIYNLLSTLDFPVKPRWLFLDDIRWASEMISWRSIESPKIDLTSFGHFSGTGLVNISKGLELG